MAWGKNGTPNTLTSTSSSLDITDLTANQFNVQLVHAFHTASLFHYGRLDGNSGSNYAVRSSALGAADTTAVNQDKYYIGDSTSANDEFSVSYILNVAGEEKFIIGHVMGRNTAGASNAPRRREHVAKFTVTTGQVTQYNSVVSTSTFASDSNISALGSDLTPAAAVPAIENVQDNSLFVEKENARRYWFDEATPITYETDFSSSTGWSQTGTQHSVNTSTGVIDWNGAASTSVHALSYDLGAVVEDNWTLRFKWVIENHTLGSNPGGWVSIGLSDSDDTVGGSANQDSVSLGSYVGGGTNYIRFHHGNDGSMRQNFTNFSTTNEEATWYVQIVKTGTSVTIGLYPDSTYGTATESKTETISGTGFQYIVVKSRSDNTNGGSVYNGTIDDMKFYNGVTSPTPATWTMQPTYYTDFSSSTNWTQTGSNITISTGTNSLTWIGDRTTSSHGLHYDLGSGIVSSKWILEFDFVLDNYSAGTASYTHQIGVMLTDVDSTSGTYGSDATRNFVGMKLNWRTDTASQQRKFYVIDDNAGTDTWADNSPANTPDDSTAQSFPTAGTTYHMKLIKDGSSHSLEIWNSSQSSLLDTLNGSNSTTADIRYILVQSYNASADGNPSFDGKIQNMKFYNGVTSIN